VSDERSDERLRLEIEEIRATIARLDAETGKLIDEGRKLRQETRFPPFVIGAPILGIGGPLLLLLPTGSAGAPAPRGRLLRPARGSSAAAARRGPRTDA
jgi:hypothetical protein